MINADADPNHRDKNNNTALYIATVNDQGLVAKTLSKFKNLDFDAACEDGKTASDVARETGNKEILKVHKNTNNKINNIKTNK